ncbi:helix-turn-helix domain-containing protein [Streptomyces sp. NPDC048172]|uniref:helix-turn-helix domain-containing protein n=1 Tax=Streptomyces sp. NPDC048172 TaxID=3365505 RepID=UPI003712BEDE
MAGGPTTRRRQLGFRLLELRQSSGLTAEQAGELAGVSKATVSRYERAKGTVRWNQVDQMCRVYGTSDSEREALVELAKQSNKKNEWWVPVADKLPNPLAVLIALEHEAARICQFAPVVVPGLLQNRDYARAIKLPPTDPLPPAESEGFLDVRMRRQKLLEGAGSPEYHVVLDESVLRRSVGGPEVMRRQLDHLLHRGREPHVILQVLPFGAGAYSTAMNSFIVLGGPDPGLDVVYLENPAGSLYLEEPNVCETFSASFRHLCREALSPDDSAELITEISRGHR